jgi:hypothetical protein
MYKRCIFVETKPKYMNIQNLIKSAQQNNFEDYLDCPHPDRVEYKNINCLIMTCMNGDYDGEVIDVLYNYITGEIISKSVYSHFVGVESKFKISN